MADNNQNKAEQYRQERKARLAKAAKKNAKNIEKKTAVRSAAKKVVAIVVAAAIALGCLTGILSYCGVIQKAVQVGYCGEEKISYSEYLYYYYKVYNQVYNQAYQASSSGYDYGYDTSLTPAEQTKTTKDADGKEITWVEFFHQQTLEMAQMYLSYYQEAKKAGIELDETELNLINSSIEEMRTQADNAGKSSADDTNTGFSLNAYLRRLYGNGISEGFFKKQLKLESIVQKYYDTKVDEYAEKYTADEVNAKFNEAPDSYQFVDMRYFRIAEDAAAAEGDKAEKVDLKAKAEAMYNAITDEASFLALAKKNSAAPDYDADKSTRISSFIKDQTLNNSNAVSSINEDLAKWAFDNGTKAGDKKLIVEKNGETPVYHIALMINPKHDVDTVTVRHILFKTTNDNNEALSDAEIKAAKDNANKTLAEWKAGDKTEASFAKYATDLSDDPGSAANGGLYENTLPGQMVSAFDKWIFDESRKEGDCEVVETEFGYHIIYFVSNDGSYKDSTIRNELAVKDFNTFSEDLLAGDTYVIGVGPRRVAYAEKKIAKKIAALVAEQQRNASSQQMGY